MAVGSPVLLRVGVVFLMPVRLGALCVRRAVYVKRVVLFFIIAVVVLLVMSCFPSHDAYGRLLWDKNEFIFTQIPTMLLLTISIFTALKAPKFHVRACARQTLLCAPARHHARLTRRARAAGRLPCVAQEAGGVPGLHIHDEDRADGTGVAR